MSETKNTVIQFVNRSTSIKEFWIEPIAEKIELDSNTEYQITAKENEFYIEFYNNSIVLYLQCSVAFLLHKRPVSTEPKNPNEWTLDFDCR